ncbi:MAG: hypothetical protein ACRDRN_13285 [Sciscionella sp.]
MTTSIVHSPERIPPAGNAVPSSPGYRIGNPIESCVTEAISGGDPLIDGRISIHSLSASPFARWQKADAGFDVADWSTDTQARFAVVLARSR